MKRIVLTFGLILGAILSAQMIIMMSMTMNNTSYAGNEMIGYATQVIVYTLVFFGIKNYRDKQLNRFISFGKAFKVGILISLLGSTMYVVSWMIYYFGFATEFADRYAAQVIAEASKKGAAELAATTKDMETFKKMYSQPIFVFFITFLEVLPVGIIITLISSLILKRKPTA